MSTTAEFIEYSRLHNKSSSLVRSLSNYENGQNSINETPNNNQNQEPINQMLLDDNLNDSNDPEIQSSSRASHLSIKNEKINLENKINDLIKIILEKDNEIQKLNNIISQKDKEIETLKNQPKFFNLKISSINACSACSQLSKDLLISDFIHTEIKAQNKKKKVISFINNYLDDYKEINKNNNKNNLNMETIKSAEAEQKFKIFKENDGLTRFREKYNIPNNIEEDNIKFTLFVTQFNRDKAAKLLLKENL